jgi:hypothetical protein
VTEETPVPETPPPGGRRLWLTVGEIVAVLGLGLAALNFWDNHHQRTVAEQEQAKERAASQAEAKAQAARTPVFILRGAADAEGMKVMLEPLKSEQVIQTQRYVFPTPILDHAMEIDAGRPQIDLAWFEKGLHDQLKAAKKAGADLPDGDAMLPVGVETTFIEDGETRTDRSVYRIGYGRTSGFLGAMKFHLVGVSLVQRNVAGDLKKTVDALWRADAPAPPAKPVSP